MAERLSSIEQELNAQSRLGVSKNQRELQSQINTLQDGLKNNASKDEVATLETRLSVAKNDLERANRELGATRENLGQVIETTGQQLDDLSRSLQRNIYQFDLAKGKRETIGDIQIELMGTKPESHQFSVEITFDGRSIQKRDCYENEPIYLLPFRKALNPVEIVVRQMGVDTIHGYVSVPKNMGSEP
jgi:hypothetical protein